MKTASERAVTVLTIPGDPPPSLNVQERLHWAQRYKLRNYWATEAWKAWLAAGQPRFRRPRIIIRLYFRRANRRDPDNFTAAIKPLLDGLKGHAFSDDDAGTIELVRAPLAVDPDNPRVEIELQERDIGPESCRR